MLSCDEGEGRLTAQSDCLNQGMCDEEEKIKKVEEDGGVGGFVCTDFSVGRQYAKAASRSATNESAPLA